MKANKITGRIIVIPSLLIMLFSLPVHATAQNSEETFEPGFFGFVLSYWYVFLILFLIIAAGFFSLYYAAKIRKRKALLKSYNTDALTGLMAEHSFRQKTDEIIKTAKPGEYEVISFDIDMFKTINTHFSIEKGTQTIVAVANALKKSFENTQAMISRRTADQFLILKKVGEGESTHQIYNLDILPAIQDVLGEKYNVTLSFGKVIIDNLKEQGTAVIGYADSARTSGKNEHKTTFITFDKKMRKLYEDRINITFRMEQALKDKEFVLVYQPKIEFKNLEMCGAEALVRWNPILGEAIYPNEFVPVFEENGFISNLDMYVFEEVCKHIKSNYHDLKMSVNLSSHTVLEEQTAHKLSSIIAEYRIPASRIELELTESASQSDVGIFLARVKQFKKIGFSVAIDDFGAGASSLNRLSEIEADVLKLDKAFIGESERLGKSMIVVADVIRMAKRLGMKVVAEGVETKAQATWLKGINCDYAQGYYFARPISEVELLGLINSKKVYSLN